MMVATLTGRHDDAARYADRISSSADEAGQMIVGLQVVEVLARRYFGDACEVSRIRRFAADVAGLSAAYAPDVNVVEALIRRALGDPAVAAKIGNFDVLVDRVGLRQIGRAQAGICLVIIRELDITDREVRRMVREAEGPTR